MDVFIMDIPGIPGESKLAGFEKKIDVLGFSHGVVMRVERGPDRTPGGPDLQDFAITKYLDSASTLLNLACCTGQDQGTVTITLGRSDQGAVSVGMVYELSHVIVSCVTISGGGEGVPLETLTLNYTQIKWTFLPPGGASPVTGGWDVDTHRMI